MADPVRIVFLGGLGEIGRNCMAIEQGTGDARSIILIDCGLMFPDADMHGIDLVLPDFSYVRDNAERLTALIATHGHEDHVGGIQYLLRDGDGVGHLRDEPLRVTIPLASDYMSVSFYTRHGMPFYALNDRAAAQRVIDLQLMTAQQPAALPRDEEITAAVEVAAAMSAFNNFNKAIGLTIDIK